MRTIATAAALGSLLSARHVSGHGHTTRIVCNGQSYGGAYTSWDFSGTRIGWARPLESYGYSDSPLLGGAYQTDDIICHAGATPAPASAVVPAGSSCRIYWNSWQAGASAKIGADGQLDRAGGHHGPVLNYLANCQGACETVDKRQLKFFKIDEKGLIKEKSSTPPYYWAGDELGDNPLFWDVTIPADIVAGNYTLRHEPINIQQGSTVSMSQHYPSCVSLQVTGGGSVNPPGISPTEFYHTKDPGLFINIYEPIDNYVIPGPPVYTKAGSEGATSPKVQIGPSSSPSLSPSPSPSLSSSASVDASPASTQLSSSFSSAPAVAYNQAAVVVPSSSTSSSSSSGSVAAAAAATSAPDASCAGPSTIVVMATTTVTVSG
ncbi:MAG: hypothetical protein M1826_006369 [Phylliscum demangeonii]|nr:MAG: hypothetical protein M1826_006369 [Phylliscum demangeonii]